MTPFPDPDPMPSVPPQCDGEVCALAFGHRQHKVRVDSVRELAISSAVCHRDCSSAARLTDVMSARLTDVDT